MRLFRALHPVAAAVALAIGTLLTAAPAAAQTMVSDRPDYPPGDTALLIAVGFAAGEHVTVQVVHADGTPSTGAEHQPWVVTADQDGNIFTTWHVCEDDCVGSTLRATAVGQTSTLQAVMTFTDTASASSPCPDSTVDVTPLAGSCLDQTPPNGGGPFNWEVAEGGSYVMTIHGVPAANCGGDTITVIVQSSSTGNFCFNATRIPSTDDFTGTFTMPSPACFTYPISYQCGANNCVTTGAHDAHGPNGECSVHLRAAIFDSSCHKTGNDETCAGCSCQRNTLVFDNCATGSSNLGCNPASIPGCDPSITAHNNCGPVPVTCKFSDSSIGCVHGRAVTYDAVSPCGDKVTCIVIYNWKEDTTAPTIGNPGANATIQCPAAPSFTAPTATDGCGTATVVEVSDVTTPGTCAGTYSRTKTWRAVDSCGNQSDTVSQTIIVADTTAPTIGAPGASGTIECPNAPVFTPPTASDACDPNPSVVEVSDVTTPGSCAGAYTRTKTWRARDCSGNLSAPVSQTITVVDSLAPTIGAPGANETIQCPATPVFTPPTASDLCSTATVNVVRDVTTPGACAGTYSRTITWDATDACGNHSAPVSQTITVVDTTAPTIGAPGANATIECPTTPSFTPPTASDTCDPNPSVVEVSDVTTPGSCAGAYTRTKTWRARDCSGNLSPPVSQTITVVDTTAPTIGAPGANATIECPTTPSFTPPTANDACDAHPSVEEVSDVTTPGSCAGAYTRTKTWRARDCSGNQSAPVSQTITVVDTTPPTIGAPGANATIECPGEPSFTPPGATDVCDASPQVMEISDVTTPGNCAGAYMRTKTWQARDCSGNQSAPVSQTITVVDTTPPTVLCPHDVVLNASGGCSANNNTTATANDTCAGALPVVPVPPGPYPIGTTVVTWTATDGCGNEGHCQQTVTVLGQICLTKYYDANANGQQEPSEPGIAGWRFDLAGPSGRTVFTDSSGSVCVNVLAGNYTITEVAPAAGWANTTPMARTVTVDSSHCSVACSFGNYCFGPPTNGLTLGFWSNKNGAKILNALGNSGWIIALNSLSLRNADGSVRTFPSNQTQATSQLQSWLLNANATNMACMLSAQLAANVLDGLFNNLSGSTVVVVPGGVKTNANVCIVPFLSVTQPISCGSPALLALSSVPGSTSCGCASNNGIVTIQDLRTAAACLLSAYGNTTGASTQRTYQECVKSILDMINNNGNNGYPCGGVSQFINPGPSSCPFRSPY